MGIFIGGPRDGEVVGPLDAAASQIMCGMSFTYNRAVWSREGGIRHVFFYGANHDLELKTLADRIVDWLDKN